jgi:tripartite-type tricarboxylate transporter receptor subunit TctC
LTKLNIITAALAVSAVMLAGTAAGQDYPSQNIKVIVPFAAGSTTDVMTRIVTDKIQEQTGQVFVIENVAGGNGIIGSTEGARATPDGYTLTVGGAGHFSGNTATNKSLPYDIFTDFVPIHGMGRSPQFVVVRADFPASTIGEFIALAKEKPGTMTFGPANQIGRMTAELLKARAGMDLRYVPYNSMEQALIDVVNGQVTMTVGSAPVLPFVESGQIKALGISSPENGALLPDVPPIANDLPGFEVRSWLGFLAPAGTPESVTAKLHEMFANALADETLQQRMTSLGTDPWLAGPDEFTATMVEDLKLWREFVEVAGIPVN